KALEALLRAGKVRWDDFAERYQIVRLGQLPKASFEEAKAWRTGKVEEKAKKGRWFPACSAAALVAPGAAFCRSSFVWERLTCSTKRRLLPSQPALVSFKPPFAEQACPAARPLI